MARLGGVIGGGRQALLGLLSVRQAMSMKKIPVFRVTHTSLYHTYTLDGEDQRLGFADQQRGKEVRMRCRCYAPGIGVVQGELKCAERLPVYTPCPNAPKSACKEMLTRWNAVRFCPYSSTR